MPTNAAPSAIQSISAPRPPYRMAAVLAVGTVACIAVTSAFGQTITTVPALAPAAVAPVPTGGFWMLALLVGLLATAGFWAIRSDRTHRATQLLCGVAVLAAGLVIAGYNPSVRAALAPSMPSFTHAEGETMDIPILPYPTEGAPTDFVPVEFTNASSARLRIAAITPPASPAVCFPSGIPVSLPATPPPEGVPACAVDLPLNRNASCVVDVAAMCAQSVAANSTYTVGGTVSGLIGGELILQNSGADNLAQCSNGSFTFSTPVAGGSAYSVTVLQQPAGQICTVSNSSGMTNGANVTNVTVNCTAAPGNTLAAKLQGWGC